MSAGRQQSGFTLVEVVVALSVLSLIMLATISALRTFANTQQSLDRMMGRVDEVRTVSSLLRDLVDSAALGADGGEGLTLGGGARDAAYFAGSDGVLMFKANILFGENFGGEYVLRFSREDSALVMRWQASNGDSRTIDWSQAASRILVRQVDLFEVAYRPAPRADWVPEWQNGGVPVALRLRLRAAERFWPELIMAVPR
ncbi:MAG: prepilin-type N-terminal cleavage/methylation domain-containing protein [Halieaceae bacterium]|jgi:general secretion pathway protein J|uniref:PulJ/GspJ family protein n=1 Tax=Haliea alexandrii TaxID=2448162 RepID=UPI000F0BA225|nr:prepilin-type N-terminal cleavage/methylation domain-containing protein [Haliea alexandrii]MCR9186941.1 prepilin-type N-terminal cleavage/methylation domain-containing protein [Halieaceae bacterium]